MNCLFSPKNAIWPPSENLIQGAIQPIGKFDCNDCTMPITVPPLHDGDLPAFELP